MKRAFLALAVALAVAGCGELKNTITPPPGTANQLTVALDSPPSPWHVGIYAAIDNGYLAQADLHVTLRDPTTVSPLQQLESGSVQIAILDEPTVLLARNAFHPVVAVAAIVQPPGVTKIVCRTPPVPPGTANPGVKRKPPAPRCTAQPGQEESQYAGAPSYNGLVFAVMEKTIVDHAPLIRRFIQAVARGYDAVRANPAQGAAQLAPAVGPGWTHAELASAIQLSLPSLFPTDGHQWGWQSEAGWNTFGAYLIRRKLITNTNATPAASTNELLAGQGV